VPGRIPQDFIDDLVTRADVAEVVGSRVQLKKAGREYKACCPFHGEKTASFTVVPDKGFYHCFGCGAHGTALGFLMEYDRLEFVEAVEELAQMLGVEVPREQTRDDREPIAPVLEVLAKAASLYQQALREHPQAVEYLRGRGLDGDTAARFGIGFAPPGWDFLLKRLGDDDQQRQLLLSAGLIAARDSGGYYDRFRDRIIFPIRDGRGRVVAFGGRVMGNDEPKYLNSPETAVFHKGRELYGLYEARQARQRLDNVLVVEGYMDVVSLACHGINNAVATLGTATTGEHLRRLFRATQQVLFCFDGDRAGRDAAWRALENSLPEMRDTRQVKFLFLPDGEDPDSLVRSGGAAALTGRFDSALPLSDYLFEQLNAQADTRSLDGQARLAELARPLLQRLPEGVYRELLLGRLAEEVSIGRDRLERLLASDPPARQAARPQQHRRTRTERSGLVRRAIQTLLHFPGLGAGVPASHELSEVQQRGIPLLCEILDISRQNPHINTAGLLERFRDRAEAPHLESLLTEEMLLEESGAALELNDCLERILATRQGARLAELVAKAESRQLTSEELEELRGLHRRSAAEGLT
jgi:DNA primase